MAHAIAPKTFWEGNNRLAIALDGKGEYATHVDALGTSRCDATYQLLCTWVLRRGLHSSTAADYLRNIAFKKIAYQWLQYLRATCAYLLFLIQRNFRTDTLAPRVLC
jgi:hypothetical protein